MSQFLTVTALNVDISYGVRDVRFINRDIKPGNEYLFDAKDLASFRRTLQKNAIYYGINGGGSGANTAYCMQRLGIPSSAVGKVGENYGRYMLRSLRGVDTSGVIKNGESSGICYVLLDGDERTDCIFPLVNDALTPNEITDYHKAIAQEASVLHLTSFFCSQGQGPLEFQLAMVENAPRATISFSPGVYCQRKEIIEPLLIRAKVLFLNRHEIHMLTGNDYKEGSQQLANTYPNINTIAVTLGGDGSYIHADKGFLAEPYKFKEGEEFVDPTGAGDVFAGVFLALRYLYDEPLKDCAAVANEFAAKSTTALGRKAYPAREDLRFLA